MLVLNKKTIDLLHSKICSIFVIEIFEIMQRNAMCSKTFVTNVLPIIFDFSPYFLIFKKIKSITQIFLIETLVSSCENICFPIGKLQFLVRKNIAPPMETKWVSVNFYPNIPEIIPLYPIEYKRRAKAYNSLINNIIYKQPIFHLWVTGNILTQNG